MKLRFRGTKDGKVVISIGDEDLFTLEPAVALTLSEGLSRTVHALESMDIIPALDQPSVAWERFA